MPHSGGQWWKMEGKGGKWRVFVGFVQKGKCKGLMNVKKC